MLAYRLAQKFIVLDVTQLFVLDIHQLPMTEQRRITFRELTYDEVLQFCSDPKLDLDQNICDRLLGEFDACFNAMVDDQLAGYYWLARNSIEAIHNSAGTEATGVAMSYPDNAIFGYKAFVHPDYRGQGLYPQIIQSAALWANRGFGSRFLISTADWTNFGALRSFERQPFTPVGLIWKGNIAGSEFTFGPANAADRGIKLGKCACVIERTARRASTD